MSGKEKNSVRRTARRTAWAALALSLLLPAPARAGSAESANFIDRANNYGQAGRLMTSTNYEESGEAVEVGVSSENAANFSGRGGHTGQRPIPAAITDLVVTAASSSTLSIQWTAPAADAEHAAGTAASYRIRYAKTGAIDSDLKFTNATDVANGVIPQAPGTLESFTIENLPPNNILAIVVEAVNASSLQGERSNSSSGTTTSPPPPADPEEEIIRDLAFAPNGSLYAVGQSSQGPPGLDVWLARYDTTPALLSSAVLNGTAGSGFDVAYSVVVDASNNLYVSGYTTMPGGARKSWMGKFNANLTLLSSATYGDTLALKSDLVMEPSGDLIFAGNVVNGAKNDVWLARVDNSLVMLASAAFNSAVPASQAAGHGVARDAAGNIYVAGVMPAPGPGPTDAWLGMFDSSLVYVTSATRAGTGGTADYAYSIAIGLSGEVFVGGAIENGGPNLDAWLARYGTNLAREAEITYDGSTALGTDAVFDVKAGNAGNIVITGVVDETGQTANFWRAEYNRLLVLQSSASIDGSNGIDTGYGVALDTTAEIGFYGGAMTATNFDPAISSSTIASPPAACGDLATLQSGFWSLATTWFPPQVPTGCNAITVTYGDTVTVDITTATASTTTIGGTLYFSRVTNSTLTLSGGDITVEPGGYLDMGHLGDNIPAGLTANLILASGTAAGEYGLIVNNGGDFTAKGSAKHPFGYATADIAAGAVSLAVSASSATGWAVGDTLAIGPTSGSGVATTETRTITSISGANPLTFSWSGGLASARTRTSEKPILVANLTRNAVIRSSGTDTGANTAYVRNLVTNATSFLLQDAELAYLGANVSGKYGVTFDGAGVKGSVSSSTFRQGFNGIRLKGASTQTLTGLLLYANSDAGATLDISAVGNKFYGSVSFANGTYGYRLDGASRQNLLSGCHALSNTNAGLYTAQQSNRNTIDGSRAYANGGQGAWLASSSSNTFTGSRFYANAAVGVLIDGDSHRNIFDDSTAFENVSHGFHIAGDGNILVRSDVFANGGSGLFAADSTGTLLADSGLGYDPAAAPLPDGSAELGFGSAGVEDLTLKNVRVHPAGGIDTAGLDAAENYLLAYHLDQATGTARFYGDHAISGSTWTFDYSAPLYRSRATPPRALSGPEQGLAVGVTLDTVTVTQLITFEHRADNNWHVSGSSSGPDLYIFPSNISGIGIPTANPQFTVSFTEIATPRPGDRIDFLLIAATPDDDTQKKLLFGPNAASLNGGRSKLTVAPTGGIELRGIGSDYTLMDRIDASSTYYTFVASGAFTARLSSMTNMDGGGIQLSGSAGVVISTSAFDYMGLTHATNAYITARNLTSDATFYSNTFGLSRGVSGAPYAYNILLEGSNTGLAWLMFQSSGAFTGEGFDEDPSGRVNWTDGATRPGTPVGAALGISSVTWTWTASVDAVSYNIYRASAAGTIIANPAGTTIDEISLATNTAYGIYIEPLHALGGGPLTPTTTVYTLALPPSGSATTQVEGSSAALSWSLNTNPAATIADIQRSTDNAAFASVAAGAVTSYVDSSLLGCTTYYFRIRNFNGDGLATEFDDVVEFQTRGSTPIAPSGLTAESLSGRRVALNWNVSPSSKIAQYFIYYDAGNGQVDYDTPLAVVTSTATSFTTGVLTSSASYTFGLRAKNACGTEEKNSSAVATAGAADALSGVRASIRSPLSGQKVAGNRLTISADITVGDMENTREVLFQYRHSTDTVWINIPAAEDAHPNPDTKYPYLVSWNTNDDLSPTPTGYMLRAVATDVSGAADTSAPTIFVEKVSSGWDIAENEINSGARIERQQVVSNGTQNSLRVAHPKRAQVTLLQIPAGALNESTMTIKVINNPSDTKPPPSGVSAANVSVKITLLPGQTDLAGGMKATLSLGYPDENNDGFVDGTSLRAGELRMYAYDDAAGAWKQEFASTIDTANRTVTGQTPHFSIFGLFAPKHEDLSSMLVYPVPFRPNNADRDDGVPFTPGDPNSGIIFDLIPEGVSIKIYNVAGQLVNELNSVSSGRVQWDVRNRDGRDAASGGYIAVIKGGGQTATIRKLLVIR